MSVSVSLSVREHTLYLRNYLWRRCDMLRSSSFTDDVIFAHTGSHRGTRCRRSEWRHCVVLRRLTSFLLRPRHWRQPRRGCRDTSPIFWLGDVNGNIPPPILLRTFGYSRPILVAPRSLSLKPISFGYKTPPIRFSQAGGQSVHKARPPNLELALKPLVCGSTNCTNFFKFVKIRKSSFH